MTCQQDLRVSSVITSERRATFLSSPFISCKMLRGEDSISQKREAICFRTIEMSYYSMHIKYHSLSFGREGLLGNS